MSNRPKRDHSAVWARPQEHFGPQFLAAGFRPLPGFGSGYDPSNRMWECWFIASPASDGIRLVDLAYAPHSRCWFVTGQLNACTDAAERIARLSLPVRLEWSLRRATLALPAFLKALARPGDPLRDGDFRVLASTGPRNVPVIDA